MPDENSLGSHSGSFNFEVCLSKILKELSGERYYLTPFDFSSCTWEVYFKHKKSNGFIILEAYLSVKDRAIVKKIPTIFQFTATGNHCMKKKGEYEFIIHNGTSTHANGWTEFLKIKSKSDFCCFGGTSDDATFTFNCKIWLGGKDSSKEDLKARNLSLVTSITNLHAKSILPDIKIKVAGSEREIQAHRAILATRSPVFLAMFENNMKEAQESLVNIEDFGEDAILSMLEYMYSGKLELLEKMDFPIEVLKLSEKYQIKELKTICENMLAKTLKVENVIEILTWADKLGAIILKDRALEFVVSNSTNVFATQGYLHLDSVSVFREINKALVKKK